MIIALQNYTKPKTYQVTLFCVVRSCIRLSARTGIGDTGIVDTAIMVVGSTAPSLQQLYHCRYV